MQFGISLFEEPGGQFEIDLDIALGTIGDQDIAVVTATSAGVSQTTAIVEFEGDAPDLDDIQYLDGFDVLFATAADLTASSTVTVGDLPMIA